MYVYDSKEWDNFNKNNCEIVLDVSDSLQRADIIREFGQLFMFPGSNCPENLDDLEECIDAWFASRSAASESIFINFGHLPHIDPITYSHLVSILATRSHAFIRHLSWETWRKNSEHIHISQLDNCISKSENKNIFIFVERDFRLSS